MKLGRAVEFDLHLYQERQLVLLLAEVFLVVAQLEQRGLLIVWLRFKVVRIERKVVRVSLSVLHYLIHEVAECIVIDSQLWNISLELLDLGRSNKLPLQVFVCLNHAILVIHQNAQQHVGLALTVLLVGLDETKANSISSIDSYDARVR